MFGEVYCSRLCFRGSESFEVADPVFRGKKPESEHSGFKLRWRSCPHFVFRRPVDFPVSVAL